MHKLCQVRSSRFTAKAPLPDYIALLTELARELGEGHIAQVNPSERANAVRRALADKRALIVIDNVETFPEAERLRVML